MKAKNIIGLILVVVILALMLLMFLQEGSKKIEVVEDKQSQKVEPKKVLTEEEQYLEDLKKQAGAKGDYAVSKYYKTACSSCHGKAGEGTRVAPDIAGKSYEYMLEKLDDYRQDRVPNSLMKGLINNLSNEDLESLAKEISNFK